MLFWYTSSAHSCVVQNTPAGHGGLYRQSFCSESSNAIRGAGPRSCENTQQLKGDFIRLFVKSASSEEIERALKKMEEES